VPLFYYVVHIYALHLIAVIGATVGGKAPGGLVLRGKSFTEGILLDYGWDLGYAYLAWIVVAVAIYPLCRAWDDYRARNRDKHWLSYL
jgi:hypothetical protein